MKKILVLAISAFLFVAIANAKEVVNLPMTPQDYTQPVKTLDESTFEQQLGLSKKQKNKAHKIQIKEQRKIKPIMKKIKAKKQEAEMVKMSKIIGRDQEARLAAIDKQIEDLEQQISDIKAQNKKKFESLLTRKQKKILKKIENNN